jgi:WD40 repeat protein
MNKIATFLIILFGCVACSSAITPDKIEPMRSDTPFQVEILLRTPSPTKPPTQLDETDTIEKTNTPSPTPTITLPNNWAEGEDSKYTSTPRPTRTLIRTSPPQATQTPSQTPIPALSLPNVIASHIGTAIPRGVAAIGLENYSQLSNIAQWGRGAILGTAFNPASNEFIVASAYGYAIYSLDDLDNPSQWVSFESPIFFDDLTFSKDGLYFLLEGWKIQQVRNYPDGQLIDAPGNIVWQRATILASGGWEEKIFSPSRELYLSCNLSSEEENWNVQFSVRSVYHTRSGKLLYDLPDETVQLTYWDYNSPMGCDLRTFSYCGNVYDPQPILPYRIGFSPSEESLAVLYRPHLGNSRYFSFLRVYDTKDGHILGSFGSLKSPVQSYSYSPDGKLILIAYVNGSIHLWNINQNTLVFSSWPFSAPINGLEYSYDGRFLIIQRDDKIEVLRVSDGGVVSRYQGKTFAVSPINYRLALGDTNGSIKIYSMDTGNMVMQITAHSASVLALAYSGDGQLLASSGEDCFGRMWDAQSGKFLHYLEANRTDAIGEGWTESRIFIYTLKFLPNTTDLIGSGSWGRVASWDVNSGGTNYLIEPAQLEYWNGMMTINPHFPEYFGVDTESGHFYVNEAVYNLADGTLIGPYQYPNQTPDNCAAAGPVTIDGKIRFTLGLNNFSGRICILDAQDNHLINSFEVPAQYALIWPFLSPDGTQLIVPSDAGPIYVYQVTP